MLAEHLAQHNMPGNLGRIPPMNLQGGTPESRDWLILLSIIFSGISDIQWSLSHYGVISHSSAIESSSLSFLQCSCNHFYHLPLKLPQQVLSSSSFIQRRREHIHSTFWALCSEKTEKKMFLHPSTEDLFWIPGMLVNGCTYWTVILWLLALRNVTSDFPVLKIATSSWKAVL